MTRSRKIKWTAMRLLVKGRRTGTRLRRSRRAGLAAAAGLIVAAAFAVGSWVAVPLWVGGKLSAWAEAETGRSAEAGRIGVNPFTLTVTLDALVLTTPAAR